MRACLFFLLLAGFGAAIAPAAVTQIGPVTNVTITVDGNLTNVNFWVNNGANSGVAQVTAFAPDVIRVRYYFSALWAKEEPMIAKQTNQWAGVTGTTYSDQGGTYVITTPQLKVVVTKSPNFKIDFQDVSGSYTLLQDDKIQFDPAYSYTGQSGWQSNGYKLKATKVMPASQAYFGLGEYGGPMNRRGREMECWNQGTYNWGEFQNPTYMNIPFFYGVQAAAGNVPAFVYGVFFNNPCRPLFSFGGGKSGANRYSFEAGDGQMDYFFFGGGASHTMAAVMDRYSELTGRATFLPKWFFGHQLSRFSYDNQDWVEYIARTATASNIPLDVVHMDIDYMQYGNLGDGNIRQLSIKGGTSSTGFPNPAGMISYCDVRGVKVVPLIEPWLEPNDNVSPTFNYSGANTGNHFIRDNGLTTVTRNIYVGAVSWFDFTSTPMRQWWTGKITNWFNSYNGGNPSFAGIWNDLTEPEGGDQIPSNARLWIDGKYGFGANDSRHHWSNERNYFGLRCASQSYETMLAKNPNKRPFVLSRSGNAGLQRYAVSWSGDTRANGDSGWFYQRATIRFGMGAMIAGAGWYGNDVGGFAGTPTEELLVRSYEANILTPFFRNHADKAALDREPWRFGNPTQSRLRGLIQFRYRLMPYLYTLAYNFTQNGEPMNTPPVFHFYSDANTTNLNEYEYMVGNFILVPPVYSQGATTRNVYLPFATDVAWYYYPNNARYTAGQTVTVNAPLGGTNIFIRSGAIIPMGHTQQYIGSTNVNFLDVQCWPEGNSSFTLYEDAGEGWDYTNATGRSQITFTSARGLTNWNFTVGARQGGYTNPVARSFFIYANNPSPTVFGVKTNGVAIPNNLSGAAGWQVANGKLGIKIPDDGAQRNVHVDWDEFVPGDSGSALGIPGTWSAWDDATPPWALRRVSPPGTPAAAKWYTNSIHVASSGGDITAGTYQFKLRANHDWANNWGGGATVNINGTTSLGWIGADASITVSNGFYYSFRVLEPTPNQSATIGVLRTTARPVSVSLAGVSPAFPKPNEAVTISIALSSAKSEENIYVRWTTNSWASCDFSLATGSGTSYSAVIPAMPNGRKVDYYILTTTATMNSGTCGSADALTLSLDTNGGVNYTFTPSPIPWPGFGYPSDPAQNIHHWKEEAVVGNGHMTVMLDANGTLYDFYFPTAGARTGTGTANEGYRGPQAWPPDCSGLDLQANGQMNLIAAMGGIAIENGTSNTVYWMKNPAGEYTDVGQKWVSDDVNVVYTSNRLNVAGYNIKVQQYDFVPSEDAIPVHPTAGARSDGVRTNRAVHVKRFLLTNQEAADKTINFYWDANFNVKGDNAYDEMFWEGTVNGTNYNAMIVRDNVGRIVIGSWCDPNGYGGADWKEYDPAGAPGGWQKSNTVYFATVMKVVTNATTGAGLPAEGSWRDHTATDNQEGWIARRITIPAGQTVEVDVMTVGSWDSSAGFTGTHTFWGRPMITWFYNNNMASVQTTTEAYWSNWLSGGVTVDFPGEAYDRLFKRSLLVSKLHADPVNGGIIAGMHNGAYPYVWPRDGIYAAITFNRTGHPEEAAAFYKWLNNVERPTEPWGKGFFYQKYTTDGKPVWRSPQVDETAGVPWGMLYHYLITGDGAFLSNNWDLAYTSARASSEDSTVDSRLYFHDVDKRVGSMNIWEDQWGEFLYSNASVVRGLRDAAAIARFVGSNSWATTFDSRATDIRDNGIVPRIDARTETSDISQLGMVVPFEIFEPTDPRMTNMVEWLNGRQTAGTFSGAEGNIMEMSGDSAGWLRRYNHKTHSDIPFELDIYWNGGPWTLANCWYGMYYARWQDYLAGKSHVDVSKDKLDLVIDKLGPMGLGAEQVAANASEQKYPDFWHQAAWPNVWESHALLLDQMMMFLDYRPLSNNLCAFAPKLPTGWSTMTFKNIRYRNQRFNITVNESSSSTHANIEKLTTGALDYDIWLRIPAGETPVLVITNNALATGTFDSNARRVRVTGPLNSAAGMNSIIVTFGAADTDGDGITDSDEVNVYSSNPLNADTDGDGMSDGFERDYFGAPTNGDPNGDNDGDGLTNLQESITGTSPLDPSSALRILTVTRQSNGDIVVTASSVADKKYALFAAPGVSGSYTPASNTNTAIGATISFTDPSPGGAGRVYKVQYIP